MKGSIRAAAAAAGVKAAKAAAAAAAAAIELCVLKMYGMLFRIEVGNAGI